MTSTFIDVDTRFAQVQMTMRDFETRPTAGTFGAHFQNLDSLLFVTALLEVLGRPKAQRAGEAARSNEIAWILGGLLPSHPETLGMQVVPEALRLSSEIRVERVTYRSPVEIVLGFVQEPVGMASLAFGGAGSAILVLNRVIKLWEGISGARIRHADAGMAVVELGTAVEAARSTVFKNRLAEAEARIKEAEARAKEAEAVLMESEIALKIEAHDVIRNDPDLIKVLFSADVAAVQAGLQDPVKSAEALLRKVGQASTALASIDDIRLITEDEVAR